MKFPTLSPQTAFFVCDDNKNNTDCSARSPDKAVKEVCPISSPFLIANTRKKPIKQKELGIVWTSYRVQVLGILRFFPKILKEK